MLCLPVFITLLLLVSPSAALPVESELQRDLTQDSPKDFRIREPLLLSKMFDRSCCGSSNTGSCCGRYQRGS
uniref:Conotoxin ba5b n=1 Tax=Conus bayani TaxID=2070216 RepID=CT5B_CONBY|nr:RecName: Full=Conotoxin ba5b; AltName: Full=Conotoxin ba5.1; Contains: RecName: Full=Conotoxin ba5a; Flags: Precursor [Conus bayani]